MRLLPQHRTLAAVIGFLLLATAGTYWFLVRPLHTEIRDNDVQIQKKQKRLQSTGFPLDSALLESEIGDLETRLNGTKGKPGIIATTQLVLTSATRMFMDRVVTGHGSPERFREDARRTFFQAEFSRVRLKLAERGVQLAPAVLGISDESSSPYIYQLILQIWTAERLADLAAETGLTLADSDVPVPGEPKGTKAADLRLLAVRGYTQTKDDKVPYLIEFPVQAVLVGELEQVKSFLRKLTSGGNFLPATHVELYTDDPAQTAYRHGRQVKVTKVRARVQCSSFFLLALPGPASQVGVGALPGGA